MGKMSETSETSEDDIDARYSRHFCLTGNNAPYPSSTHTYNWRAPPIFFTYYFARSRATESLNVNANTAKSTGMWVKRFNKQRTERQIGQKLEEIPKEQLHGILQLFFAEIHKNDGANYELASLRTMMAALDRYL